MVELERFRLSVWCLNSDHSWPFLVIVHSFLFFFVNSIQPMVDIGSVLETFIFQLHLVMLVMLNVLSGLLDTCTRSHDK